MGAEVSRLPTTESELRAALAAVGATPAAVATLLDGLDEPALARTPPGGRSCLALLEELVVAGANLGVAAHDLLGHVPNGGASRPAAPPHGAGLQSQLRFLREHIVSTVDQQGAAVWWTPDAAGQPLVTHVVALQARDRALLTELQRAALAASAPSDATA